MQSARVSNGKIDDVYDAATRAGAIGGKLLGAGGGGFMLFFVRPHDLEVVEPRLALHVPAWRQHDDPAVGEGCQVVLDAAVAERVLDTVLLIFPRQVRFGDEEPAVDVEHTES